MNYKLSVMEWGDHFVRVAGGDGRSVSPICDFLPPIVEQQKLFKEGECNSPLQ